MKVTRTAKILLWILGGITGIALVLAIAALTILPSEWFREKVRARIVYEVEKASGGRAEIGAFRFDWSRLTAEVAPFVLHGTEPPGEAPLFRAESIRVGLKIISILRHDIDLALVYVEQPRLNLLVDASGITNIPKPKIERKSSRTPVELLVDLAIRDITLRNGEIHYGDRKIPLDVSGRYLNARLLYDFSNPAYQGSLGMQDVHIAGAGSFPVTLTLDSDFRLLKNRVEFQHARLSSKESSVELSGALDDFRTPQLSGDVAANGSLAELGTALKLPPPHVGNVNFTGKLLYQAGGVLQLNGRATGQHLAVRQSRVNIQEISFASDLQMSGKDLKLRDVTVHALDGIFRGSLDVNDLETFRVNGKLSGVSVGSLTRMADIKNAAFGGTVEGPVEVTGSFRTGAKDLKAGGRFNVAARQDGVPVNGFVEVAWSQRRNTVQLGQSWLALPNTRVDFRGTLGEELQVGLTSTDLNDFRPALAVAMENPPEKLPLDLTQGGSASFDGTVSGPIDQARARGNLTLTSFTVENQKIDRLSAAVDATKSGVQVRSLALGQNELRVTGSADVALQNWRPVDTSSVAASLQVEGAEISRLVKQAGQNVPVSGVMSAQVNVTGTMGAPQANLRIDVAKPVIYEEPFDRVTAEVRYQGAGIEIINGVASAGDNRILVAGSYSHPLDDLKNGQLKFNVSTEGWQIEEIRNVRKVREGIAGHIRVKASGLVNVRNADLFPATVDGNLAIDNLTFSKNVIGNFTAKATTAGQQLSLSLSGDVRGSQVAGKGSFQLAGDYPGTGELSLTPMRLSTLQDLVLVSQGKPRMPVGGMVEGRLTFSGPLRKPEQMTARIELPQFRILPSRRTNLSPAEAAELSLRNEGPIVAEYDGKSLQIRSAHLVGRDTDLQATGSIASKGNYPADIRLNGNLNLAVLQNFNPDVVSSGVAVINASVRGSMQDPQLAGRMELRDASLYIADFPNGLDNLTGTVLFDRRRATIEKLRATTGGGDLLMSGFVGFGTGDTVYQLQARADKIRIRYPEGTSTTANATLSLTGTASRSLLSGVVTIVRAGFNPRTDIGGLLASAPAAAGNPSIQNEFLRNMALDIHVDTVPNLQFQTSLTANLQADADLRVRGTAAKPVVLGRVVVSQGEIQFFGNKYTINRGEIGFFNPVRIEPVLDLSLETQARGVKVTINFNGTLQKLNASYQSDPPLQSNEIIALLAVGRAPGTNSSLASSQTVSNSSLVGTGTGSLLGQAVATPVSNRLQRFFGVSKLKIDPQLTGLSAIPQARLTIEQQISRDITLTYVTNLSQANQQIIRVEWNLSRTWSVVAVREENGVFGVDFFFKKRLR